MGEDSCRAKLLVGGRLLTAKTARRITHVIAAGLGAFASWRSSRNLALARDRELRDSQRYVLASRSCNRFRDCSNVSEQKQAYFKSNTIKEHIKVHFSSLFRGPNLYLELMTSLGCRGGQEYHRPECRCRVARGAWRVAQIRRSTHSSEKGLSAIERRLANKLSCLFGWWPVLPVLARRRPAH
jgi:hypothetical protein